MSINFELHALADFLNVLNWPLNEQKLIFAHGRICFDRLVMRRSWNRRWLERICSFQSLLFELVEPLCFTRVLFKLKVWLSGFVVTEYLSDGVSLFELGHELFHLVNFFVQLRHLLVVRVIFLVLVINYWNIPPYMLTSKIDSLEITLGVQNSW